MNQVPVTQIFSQSDPIMKSNVELNIENREQLITYLHSQQLIAGSETITTQVLASGVSNRTMLVALTDGTMLSV